MRREVEFDKRDTSIYTPKRVLEGWGLVLLLGVQSVR